jgi:O-antigen/teichoic acid export membrane protein
MTAAARIGALLGGRVRRGVLWNLAGIAPPVLFAFIALPLLAARLGPERFGVLLIAWGVLLYVGVLNLGVGRALVHATASRGEDDPTLPSLVWTAVLLLAGIGTAAGAALFVLGPLLARGVLGTDAALAREAAAAFRLLAFAVPFALANAGLTAVLEARGRFGTLNAAAVPVSAANLFGPVAALAVSDSLMAAMAALVAARVLAWALHLVLALRAMPALRQSVAFHASVLPGLLGYGGWVTVSGIVSPLMQYSDRVVVGAILSASAVAYYATPQEMVIRLGVLSTAVTVVLFPAFAGAATAAQLRTLLERGTAAVWAMVLPVAVLLSGFGGEILGLWMGADYGAEGRIVLRWLAAGMFANALARVAAAYLLGVGRPDLTGRLHLAELPVYAAVLWLLTQQFGVHGAAAAWFLRTAGDAFVLFLLVVRLEGAGWRATRRPVLLALAGGGCVAVPALLPGPGARLGFLVLIALAAAVLAAWVFLRPVSAPAGGTDPTVKDRHAASDTARSPSGAP